MLNAQMRSDEVRHVIEDSAAALVIRSANEVDGSDPLAFRGLSEALFDLFGM